MSFVDIERTRAEVAATCRRMVERGYGVAGDGNVSVRLGRDRVLITPSGGRKGELAPGDLVICDLEGNTSRARGRRPSSELPLHALVYRRRPDVFAVVHAHPPCAVAHTIAGVPLEPLVPEAFVGLGPVAVAPYAPPASEQLALSLEPYVLEHQAILLERHGSVTVGASLDEAFDRLEILEHLAKMSLMARSLAQGGAVAPLSASQRIGLAPTRGAARGPDRS